jgi:hypothetical protein
MAGVGQRAPAEPTANDDPNIVDDTDAWAALEKELETPDPILDAPPERVPGEPEPPPPPPPRDREPPAPKIEAHDDDDAPEPPEPIEPDPSRPKIPYETLEQNQRRTAAALKEEREARRRSEENTARLIEELRARTAPPPPAPPKELPPLPDVNEDPIGHFTEKVARLEAALAHTYQQTEQVQRQRQAQVQEQQFWNHVRAAEDTYRPTTPVVVVDGKNVHDYDLACEHLRAHRMTELTHLYPDNSQVAMAEARQYGLPSPAHLRAAILQSDAVGIAQRAYQLGISPAQLYYAAAKGRGYVTPAGTPTGKTPNGKIETTKRGQKAALTISGGEGRKSTNDMSISDLSDLFVDDPEEFDKQWDRMARAGKLG